MKKYFLFVVVFNLLLSCKKETKYDKKIENIKVMLTGGDIKIWTLSKLYVNDSELNLTPGQSRFTKTYKINNTWIDSDGYSGTFNVPGIQNLSESTLFPPQLDKRDYIIKSINNSNLELEYSIANSTYRLIFTL